MTGALSGMRVIEFAGIGPAPFCGMMLSDHGCEVVRIERAGATARYADPMLRNRKSVILDLKTEAGVDAAKALCRSADGMIEGFRPGVMEKLGLGPDILLGLNPRLVYGRMTGWGQYGSYAPMAGHDINYIALAGVLHGIGTKDGKPIPPLNYIGDFGGGGMMLAFGMVAGLLAVRNGGPGQVIDCAMTDGSALLGTMVWTLLAAGRHDDVRGVNRLDGGAHYYNSYQCSDGEWIAVGSIEPQFYAILLRLTGLDLDPDIARQEDMAAWPELSERLATVFGAKSRTEWCSLFEGTDACFAPILSLKDAPAHPHNAERKTFVEIEGIMQPAPAPRFSQTPAAIDHGPRAIGADTAAVLAAVGLDAERIALASGVGA